MRIHIAADQATLGSLAAEIGADKLRRALQERGAARLILATGVSQLEVLRNLVNADGIDWSAVEVFHLDEYIGIANDHPASFRRYIYERFVNLLPPLQAFHPINGDADNLAEELTDLGRTISRAPVDIAFVGIGNNGHLAFNDPPADFDCQDPFLRVNLADTCIEQQLSQGWFASYADVPKEALTMSIHQIMKTAAIVGIAVGRHKAAAVRATLSGPIGPTAPASILRRHRCCDLLLDPTAMASLSGQNLQLD